MRGRWRSSRRRWLCSNNRRSLSSDIDWRVRELMLRRKKSRREPQKMQGVVRERSRELMWPLSGGEAGPTQASYGQGEPGRVLVRDACTTPVKSNHNTNKRRLLFLRNENRQGSPDTAMRRQRRRLRDEGGDEDRRGREGWELLREAVSGTGRQSG